ncbi:MAG: phosphoribosyl-AMP cyclohydrolase [Pseudomonadales bacterium]|jgi:phosphoribosyl-AMP cyclohydrolase|nr:phosphoribosyl-AMP cyclohydrolase [Pseudomonadales bacterium]
MAAPSDFFRALEGSAPGTAVDREALLAALAWNTDGLVPAIAQQHDSREVLMLAWMNEATLRETLETGRVCYWSRSRKRPWRKGEESGHVQRLVELRVDCDGDTLLLLVDQAGPACHTGRANCFYLTLSKDGGEVRAAVEVDPASVYGRS